MTNFVLNQLRDEPYEQHGPASRVLEREKRMMHHVREKAIKTKPALRRDFHGNFRL
jgi:hypothetical protein